MWARVRYGGGCESSVSVVAEVSVGMGAWCWCWLARCGWWDVYRVSCDMY